MDNLKFTAKINTLKKIQPKVHETLKNYYLPKILQKWKYNTYDQTVKCTKDIQAFLRVADGADVKAVFSVVFEDATSIKAIAKEKSPLDNVELFNLAGQRVSKAQQGVYIHNGHKVLVK